MSNRLPHASTARFAQALGQTFKLLFELWLEPYPNRHNKMVLNDSFNSLVVMYWD